MTISVAYTAADASVLSQIISSSPMRISEVLRIGVKFLFRGADVLIGVCRVWSLEQDETFSVFVFDPAGSVDVWASDEPGECCALAISSEELRGFEVSLFDSTLFIGWLPIMFPRYLCQLDS